MAAELAGLDARASSAPPDVLGELTEKFLALADEIAKEHGGAVTREDASAVTITFPQSSGLAAASAASCAVALRDAARDLIPTLLKDLGSSAYLKLGVDAVASGAPSPGGAPSPRNRAKRLRNKAGKWAILAGENVCSLTADDFQYATVGFYQARSGEPAVKIYQLEETRRRPARGAPPDKEPYVPQADLQEAIDAFLAGVVSEKRRRTLFIKGGPGTGKTTLLEAAQRIARENGFRTFAATCFARRRYEPFAAWVIIWSKLFAALAPEAEPEVAPLEALKKIDPRLEIWAPLFAQVLRLPADLNPYVADVTPAFRHRRVVELATRIIAYAAREQPTALLFDDLHLADHSTRALLTSVLAHVAEGPLAVIFTADPPDDSLTRAADVALTTRPLTEEETSAFAPTPVGQQEDDRAAVLFALSKGRPDLLKQIWLLSLTRPEVKLAALGSEGPPELAAVVGRRLRDFAKPWQQATAILAAVGLPLREDDISALAADCPGEKSAEAEAWPPRLKELGLLRTPAGEDDGPLYVPPHLANALLAALAPTQEDRAAAASAAANLLTRRYRGELSARATLELEAGNTAAAYHLTQENATRARWLGSPHEAVDQLTIFAHELKKDEPKVEEHRAHLPKLYYARAEAFREAGLVAAALSDLENVEADEENLSAQRLYAQGRAYLLRDYYDEAEHAFLAALQNAVRAGDDALVADIEISTAELLGRRGDVPKAVYQLGKSLKTNRAPSPAAYRLLAELKYRSGHVAAAARAAKKSTSLTDPAKKPVTAAETGLTFSPIFFEYGPIPGARNLLANSRRVFELLGDPRNLCETFLVEGGIDLLTQDLATSENTYLEALRLAEADRFDGCAARASLGLSAVALYRGDLAGYRRFLVKAKEISTGEATTPAADFKLAEARNAYFADENYDDAYMLADTAAIEYRRGDGGLSYGEAALLAARAALARGKPSICRKILGQADLERRANESKVFFASYNETAGLLLSTENDRGRAATFLRAAAAAARELGLWLVGGQCYLDLAAITPDRDEREKYRRRALWLFKNKGAALLAERAEKKTAHLRAGERGNAASAAPWV